MNENVETDVKLEFEEKMMLIRDLREKSRYKYFEMREEQQLDLFQRRLKEEKRLFADIKLSKEEKEINSINEKLFELANKARQKPSNLEAYKMPDAYEDDEGNQQRDKKYEVLYKRYEEEPTEMTEQDKW